ncbi:polysaccharide pyruvyl transferase family protein [Vibrio fluvialis]|nr:polysaccharide pyruvyl transferase family protein [Vibrio fluvialis]
MQKIAIVGALWTPNFGDVLLGKLFKNAFELKKCEVGIFNASEPVLREMAGKGKPFSFKEADHVIFCGGGYFSEPPGNSYKWALSRYKLLFKYATLCQLYGIKYSILGVGAGPINSFLAKKVIKHVCKGAQTIALRDPTSVSAISNLLPNKDIIEVADYVLSLKDKMELKEYEDKNSIGFHITINGNSYIPGVIEYVKEVKETNSVFFIEDHPGEFNRVSNKYPEVKNIFENNILFYKDVDNFINDINSLSYVVTSKLHVGIVASALGKKVCSMPYHAKVKRLYESFGRDDLCLSTVDSTNQVVRHLRYCMTSEPITVPHELIMKSRKIDEIIIGIIENDSH